MAYHITAVINNSAGAVATTNPAHQDDSKVVAPGTTYKPERPILINKGANNLSWAQAVLFANNFYTIADDFCIWDNGTSQIVGIGQKTLGSNDTLYLSASAGNVQVTIDSNGNLSFASA
jgi:hypothetical protein